MTFSSLRVGGLYLYVTRLRNKYLILVREIDIHTGCVLATRSTVDGNEVSTRWYREGTLSSWRCTDEAIQRLLADTTHTPGVLYPQSKACRPVGLHVDDPVGDRLQAVE